MRFIIFMKASKDSEAGVMPTDEQLLEMGKFNEEMVKAGILLDGTGLQATSRGARVSWASGKPVVTEGPFPFSTEIVSGFWVINVQSKEEALQWATRIPGNANTNVEVRQYFELEDFAPGEGIDKHKQLREQMQA
jgi:hypothetical protein